MTSGYPSGSGSTSKSHGAAADPHLYGRFDLRYDGRRPPVLLEYNADTPTTLLEASILQWHWKTDVFPDDDQWNSLHERLVARWAEIRDLLPGERDALHLVLGGRQR